MKNKINKEIFSNIIIAIILLAYFFIIPIIYNRFLQNKIFEYLEIPAIIFLQQGYSFLKDHIKKIAEKYF